MQSASKVAIGIQEHKMLPTWQRDNAYHCEEAMLHILSNSGRLRSLGTAAVVPGRKLRASLALQYMKWADIDTGSIPSSVLFESLAKAEFLHSASCILDDIIDGDTVRRGQPVFHIREGLPQAILTAQDLIGIACTIEPSHPEFISRRVQDALVASVRAALRGEACDSFPLHDTFKHLSCGGELEQAYLTKTTPGFEVAHRIVGIVCGLPNPDVDQLACFGAALGAYYQYANDYHDWFRLDPGLRGSETELVLVSLCIPTIVALARNAHIGELVGTHIQRKQFAKLIEELRSEGVERLVRERLEAARDHVWTVLPIHSRPTDLEGLLGAIDSAEFWGYNYQVAPT